MEQLVSAAKKRFEDLMDYVKKEQHDVPFQSGRDDQAPSTDLENALDDDFKKAEAERAEMEFQFKREEDERAHELQKLQFEVNKEMLLFLRSQPPPYPVQKRGDKF
jgi:hypothetical protein